MIQRLQHQAHFDRRQGPVLGNERRNRRRSDIVGGVGHFFAVKDREDVYLLDDVTHVDGSGRRSPVLDLVAQGTQVISADLGQQPVLQRRQDVPKQDGLAHRPGAVGHPVLRRPPVGELPKRFGGGQAPLLPLLVPGGRATLGDRLLGIQQFLPGVGQRESGPAKTAEGHGLAATVKPVVVAEGDRACR